MRAALRRGLAMLPDETRHGLLRRMVRLETAPDPRLTLKIADTEEELAACFRLLHGAYVAEGYMKPDPSGMRVTMYHALPTTTTLCAKWDGEVVGTISMIREGVFGFPMQQAFDFAPLRTRPGQIAEISSLAVHPAHRRTGGRILFPLMKFMFEYCRTYFDTRHLVIAVHPTRFALYEALLLFRRLPERTVDHYDFANGAPAVGAALDVSEVPARCEAIYGGAPPHRDLFTYFMGPSLPNIQLPDRPLFTTNDPVMTPALLDRFFNLETDTFERLDDRRKLLLHSIYDHAAYRAVLPEVDGARPEQIALRRHQRFSLRCPATLRILSYGGELEVPLDVVEISLEGMGACTPMALPEGTRGRIEVQLGLNAVARVRAETVRCRVADGVHHYGMRVLESDPMWQVCVDRLQRGHTHADLASPQDLAQVAVAAARVAAGMSPQHCTDSAPETAQLSLGQRMPV